MDGSRECSSLERAQQDVLRACLDGKRNPSFRSGETARDFGKESA
jgi:hypothetical protein